MGRHPHVSYCNHQIPFAEIPSLEGVEERCTTVEGHKPSNNVTLGVTREETYCPVGRVGHVPVQTIDTCWRAHAVQTVNLYEPARRQRSVHRKRPVLETADSHRAQAVASNVISHDAVFTTPPSPAGVRQSKVDDEIPKLEHVARVALKVDDLRVQQRVNVTGNQYPVTCKTGGSLLCRHGPCIAQQPNDVYTPRGYRPEQKLRALKEHTRRIAVFIASAGAFVYRVERLRFEGKRSHEHSFFTGDVRHWRHTS
jgi:hypothetical protein